MFTEKCFIRKNTKELQDKLSKLGYANYYDDERSSNGNINDGSFLFVDTYIEYDIKDENIIEETPYYCCVNTDDLDGTDYGIDCGENEDLFLAIAALRDDNDYMQWFTYPLRDICYKCINKYWIHIPSYTTISDTTIPRKATVKELIEYFK